ncbi:unnamed protein product [Brassica rapa]|uniref:Uncharacterized protein n=1 Tax=Brassica campestris TaxID=3711 RepID=A0A3P6D1Z0_BRACM|nr:unnamed protein product [Brassica rapa]VDD18704.1 unnamed protein product [Brassica rapa]
MADFQKSTQRVKWVFTPQKLGLSSYVLTFDCLYRVLRMRKNLDGAYIKDVVAESDPTAEPT